MPRFFFSFPSRRKDTSSEDELSKKKRENKDIYCTSRTIRSLIDAEMRRSLRELLFRQPLKKNVSRFISSDISIHEINDVLEIDLISFFYYIYDMSYFILLIINFLFLYSCMHFYIICFYTIIIIRYRINCGKSYN